MGLSPEYYNNCTDDVLNLYAELEDRVIADVVRRIVKTGDITETAKWQLRQAQQMGLLYDDIIKDIAKSTNKTDIEIKKMFEKAGVETVNNDNRLHIQAGKSPLDIRQSESMLQILNGVYKNSLTDLKNLTGTTAITSQTAYYNACNSAFMMVSSGAFSYQQALRTVIQEVGNKGVTVSYPSGHIDRLDVAVRRSLLTGIGLASRQISEENSRLCECDLMEISAHSGARPSHAVWQGQIVSLSGRRGYLSKSDIGYGTGAGFGGWNCRHDWYPFYEGISTRNYTQSDLDKLNAKDIEYNGKMYSEYEISQMLRKKEREIRSLKREKVAIKTAIEEGQASFKSDLTTINGKIRDKSNQIQEFCNQTGYKRDRFREQVSDKTSVGHTTGNTQKYKDTLKNGLTSNYNSDMMISSNTDLIISQEVLTHSNLGEFTAYNNPKKPEKGGGKFAKGGHGEANIKELQKRGIKYNIEVTYDNGVRAGNVPTHKETQKRTGIGQAWFPESWDENKIKEAGEYVLQNREVIIPINNPFTGEIVGYNIFAKYEGVTVGIFTDKDGKLSGKNGTIFPDSNQREIGDIKDENK